MRSEGTQIEACQLVTFELDGRLFGIGIHLVKEVSPVSSICRVPRTPRHIRGLVNVRGQVVLVLDVAAVLGHDVSGSPTSESRLVILKTAPELAALAELDRSVDTSTVGDRPVGLLVDRIGDVVAVPRDSVEPPPNHLDRQSAHHHQGVVRHGDDLLVVLNAGSLL